MPIITDAVENRHQPQVQMTLFLTSDRHLTYYIGIGRIRPLESQPTQDDALGIAHGGFWRNKLPPEIFQQNDRLFLLRRVYLIRLDAPDVPLKFERDANSYHTEGPPEPSLAVERGIPKKRIILTAHA